MNPTLLKSILESVSHLKVTGQVKDIEISHITSDSRMCIPGSLFVAVKGAARDGHKFISNAYGNGARIFAVEDTANISNFEDAIFILVSNTREFLDQALCVFYQDPSKDLVCIGVTGTNGKTTITHLIELILNAQNLPTAVMGTIDHHLGNKKFPTEMTTPGPELLQKRIYEFKQAGAKALAMEVSSHALHQHRADSIKFDIAVFTNLTRDHLDYHATIQDYFAAKQRLFDDLLWKSSKFDRFAIINGDDFYGRWLKTDRNVQTFYYGQKNSDFLIRLRAHSFEGTEFAVEYNGRRYILNSKMIGLHNVYNLTAAFAVGAALKLDLEICARILEEYPGVPGRLEKIENSKGVHVFVDYAHTDDALKNVLESLKLIKDQASPQSKVITVFGCGGDRDRGKRPIMAKISQEYSDEVIVTSDNPRTEDPTQIINEVLLGFSPDYLQKSVRNVVDRKQAIALALNKSNAGDVVLIAGKGHEDYQIIGKDKIHFSDAEIVRELAK